MEVVPQVLIVDDRPDVAETLAAVCEAAGYRVAVAAQGQSMQSMLRHHAPAAVLLDILMPDEDGYEALRAISEVDASLPVLLISGAGESWLRMGESLAHAHGLTAIRLAPKPVGNAALRGFLRRWCRFAGGEPGGPRLDRAMGTSYPPGPSGADAGRPSLAT